MQHTYVYGNTYQLMALQQGALLKSGWPWIPHLNSKLHAYGSTSTGMARLNVDPNGILSKYTDWNVHRTINTNNQLSSNWRGTSRTYPGGDRFIDFDPRKTHWYGGRVGYARPAGHSLDVLLVIHILDDGTATKPPTVTFGLSIPEGGPHVFCNLGRILMTFTTGTLPPSANQLRTHLLSIAAAGSGSGLAGTGAYADWIIPNILAIGRHGSSRYDIHFAGTIPTLTGTIPPGSNIVGDIIETPPGSKKFTNTVRISLEDSGLPTNPESMAISVVMKRLVISMQTGSSVAWNLGRITNTK